MRARTDAGRGCRPLLLALTSYAHGYAVLWAGLTASGLLLWDRRPLRALGWLAAVAALAFALAAPSLVPLLAAWGWTTPYDDAWIDVTTRGLLPALLWPLFACAVAGVALMLVRWRAARTLDRRLLLLVWGAVAGAALACAGPGLGVIDVRFAPFAQLALALVRRRGARSRRGSARARGRRGARARAAGRGARRRAVAGAAVLDRLELLGARGQGAVARLERALRADPRRRL